MANPRRPAPSLSKADDIIMPNDTSIDPDGPMFVINWLRAYDHMHIDMMPDGVMLYVTYGNRFTNGSTAVPIGWYPHYTIGL